MKNLLPVALTFVALNAVLSGCGKKNRVEGGTDETAAEPVSAENYVPEQIYKIDSYAFAGSAMDVDPPITVEDEEVSDTENATLLLTDDPATINPLAKYTQKYNLAEQSLTLAPGVAPVFYAGFPIDVRFGLKTSGGDGAMNIVVGLIDKAADGLTKEEQETAFKCVLGTVSATFGSSASDGEGIARYVASLLIPQSCLKNGEPTEMMLYFFANPDGSVQPSSGEKKQVIVLDTPTIEREGICLKFDPGTSECQKSLIVEKSPGVNVRLAAFAGENSVGIVPSADPLTTLEKQGRLPRSLIATTSTFYVEGLAPDDPDRDAYKVQMEYALCADPLVGQSRSRNAACDGSNQWVTLHDFSSVDLESDTIAADTEFSTPQSFSLGQSNGVSAPLNALGGGYRTIATGAGGPWAYQQSFVIRACASILKNGELVEERNRDFQAVDGADATADNCLLFPIIMANERVNQLTPCDSGDTAETEDCRGGKPADSDAELLESSEWTAGDGGTELIESGAAAELAAAPQIPAGAKPIGGKFGAVPLFVPPVKTYAATWEEGWGQEKLVRVTASMGGSTTFTTKALSFRTGFDSKLQGIAGKLDISLFDVHADMFWDLWGTDKHYFETYLGVLNLKIFGNRYNLPGQFYYEFPIAQILGTINKVKSMSKVKKKRVKKNTKKNEKPEIEDDIDWNNNTAIYVQEFCKKFFWVIWVVPVELSFCGDAGLFLSAGLEGSVTRPQPGTEEDKEFPGSIRVARGAVWFSPSFVSNAGAGFGPSLGIASTGIRGSLNLISLGFPNVLSARFGNYETPINARNYYAMKADARFTSDMTLETLSGKFEAFAALNVPTFCGWWCWYSGGWRLETKEFAVDIFEWPSAVEKRYSFVDVPVAKADWKPLVVMDPYGNPTTLKRNEVLMPTNGSGTHMASHTGRLRMYLYENGTIMLKGYLDIPHPVWWIPHTASEPGAFLYMTNDGDVQLRNSAGKIFWNTGTGGNPDAEFTVEDDGDLVIRNGNGQVLWSNGTKLNACSKITTGSGMPKTPNKICSSNGLYYAQWRGGTKFGVYQTSTNEPIWENTVTPATGEPRNIACMKNEIIMLRLNSAGRAEALKIYDTRKGVAGTFSGLWVIENDGTLKCVEAVDRFENVVYPSYNPVWENK